MKSLQGHLLIASPKLLDPNFHRAVVLIVQHNDQGALGLIVNRPIDTNIDQVWQQVSESPCLREDPLHQGGPCEGTLMVLHGEADLAQMKVIPGVYFSTELPVVEQLVSGASDEIKVKFFVGHSGWAPSQLEAELEGDAWLTYPARPEHIFEDNEELWDILRRQITLRNTYPALRPEMIPDDPSVN